jgi:hypothetical protein
MTTVVKINAARDNFTLYIGRAVIPDWGNAGTSMPASKWQNPYRINAVRDRTESLRLYEEHIRNTPRLWASLYEIDDQVLGCWCCDSMGTNPEPWCHGDVLIKLRQEQREHAVSGNRRGR